MVIGGLLVALLALKGSSSTLAERLNPLTYLDSQTANERRFVWYKTDLLNADHFWLGVGNGSWKIWFPSKSIQGAYRLQEENVVFTRAHNDYLEVRAEMGIIGIVLFCAMFGMAFLAAWLVLRKKDTGQRERHDLLVLTAGLLGYCVIQFLDFPRERIECQVVLGIFFAYIAFHTRVWWERRPAVGIQRLSGLFLWALAAGLAFNLVVGWNRVKGEIHNVKLLEAPFHMVLTAQQAKAYKPRLPAFEYMIDMLACDPKEILHVSASLRYDLMSARDIGIRGGRKAIRRSRPGSRPASFPRPCMPPTC